MKGTQKSQLNILKSIATKLFLALVLVVALLGAQSLGTARAASLTVTTTADSGAGSLRDAITTALASPGADTITFSVSGTITLVSGLPDIASSGGALTIDGAGQTITISISCPSCTPRFSVFTVDSGASLTLNNLTVTNGYANYGGGINNAGAVTITHSTFSDNSAYNAAGAIYNNAGALTITNSTFSDNSQGFSGAAIYNLAGTLTITSSTFSGNSSSSGAAIYNDAGAFTLTITNSTFSDNIASDRGGAIYNTNGAIIIANSTFSGNSGSYGGGGGIDNTAGTVTITNSTFSGNSAPYSGGGKGGGIDNEGTLTVTNSTFFGNSSNAGGAIFTQFGTSTITSSTFSGNSSANFVAGIYGGTLTTLRYTIVANNSGTNCSGSITDGGHNLVYGDSTCPGTNADPKLQALAYNGGSTQTMALGAGSAALDTGGSADCPATDQRGVPRPYNAVCDIGAYELAANVSQSIQFGPLAYKTLAAPPFVITATASSGLTVAFGSSTSLVCSVSASSWFGGVSSATVTLIKGGSCTLVAQQPGNSTFAAAANVTQTFGVETKIFLPLIMK